MSPPKSSLSLDFVVYAGEPERGAELPSAQALEEFEKHREVFKFDAAVYGAVLVEKGGKPLFDPTPDIILSLVTKVVRVLPYVMDGEPETALLSESAHGFLFERVNDDVLVAFFRGEDAFEPEEFLLDPLPISLDDFAVQLIGMGDRMAEMLKKWDPIRHDSDDFGKSLYEFLEVSKNAYRAHRLEKERLRRR